MTISVTWGNPTAQFGSADAADVWATLPFDAFSFVTLDAALNLRAGVIFDAGLRFDSSGHALDSPILTAFTLRAIYLNFGAFPAIQVEYFLLVDPEPADFASGALAPLNRGEVSLGTLDMTLALGNQTTVDFSFSAAQILQARAQITSRARWNGRFALAIRSNVAGPIFLQNNLGSPLLLLTTQEPFFAGLTGGPSGKVRAVRDGRYGMPAWNGELVSDGDQPGLFVRPWDFDPEDEEATYRPRPGEGSVDDPIPDL